MIGYICFFFTALFYIGLAMHTASGPGSGSDSGMAYGIGFILLGFGLTLSSLALTILINAKGGFSWIAQDPGLRTLLVFSSWLLIIVTTLICATLIREWYNWEKDYPQFLYWLAASYGHIWIPLLWLLACFLSLRPEWQSTVPAGVLSVSFWVALGISMLFSVGLVTGYTHKSTRVASAEVARLAEQENKRHRENLDFIAGHKPDDPLYELLRFSTHYQPDNVHQAALAKIKSHPNWEAELLSLLTSYYAPQEVYDFLSSNSVEHPESFAQPLKLSILRLSKSIEDQVKDGPVRPWDFGTSGINQLLEAIDRQFPNQTADFYPNILKLQQALNAPRPEQFKDVRITVTDEVDGWLRQHRK